jgi:hypothetical protein
MRDPYVRTSPNLELKHLEPSTQLPNLPPGLQHRSIGHSQISTRKHIDWKAPVLLLGLCSLLLTLLLLLILSSLLSFASTSLDLVESVLLVVFEVVMFLLRDCYVPKFRKKRC